MLIDVPHTHTKIERLVWLRLAGHAFGPIHFALASSKVVQIVRFESGYMKANHNGKPQYKREVLKFRAGQTTYGTKCS